MPWTHSLVYLDDIIICTFKEHTHRLCLVYITDSSSLDTIFYYCRVPLHTVLEEHTVLLATGTTSCIWEVERSPGKCARAGLSQYGQEKTEHECEAEVAQPTDQSQRPVHMRKSRNHYGEWILNGLQQLPDCLKMLEDKARKYKEPIKTLKPKFFVKKANTLQENYSFFQWDKLSRVFINRLNWLTSFWFITWSDHE